MLYSIDADPCAGVHGVLSLNCAGEKVYNTCHMNDEAGYGGRRNDKGHSTMVFSLRARLEVTSGILRYGRVRGTTATVARIIQSDMHK